MRLGAEGSLGRGEVGVVRGVLERGESHIVDSGGEEPSSTDREVIKVKGE